MATLSNRRAPSVKALMAIKDVTCEDAEAIRTAWKTTRSRAEAREAIDRILSTHGVEYLGQHKRSGEHVDYCNAGDAYASTVVFIGMRCVVACWGDYVEKNLIRGQ